MTFFILDPNLENEHGHHLNWDLSIASAARERGERVVVYANREFTAAVPAEVTIVPYFSYSTYLRRSKDPITGRFDDFRYFNDVLAEELAALPRGRFEATDTVLVPTLSETHLFAYASWMKSFDPAAAPLFVIHLMFPSGLSAAPCGGFEVGDELQALLYRLAFDIADRPGTPIYFFGGGRQIAREFSHLTGRRIEPHPVPICPKRTVPRPAGDRRVALLYAGDAKVEKGICLLPDLARRLCAAHPEWDFIAHVNSSSSWGNALDATKTLEEIAPSLANLRLTTGHLPPDAYLQFLSEAHCLVCTYDPTVYAHKSSGVVWEAISLGIPVLVPSNCWLENEAKEWGAGFMSYAPYSPEAVCEQFDQFSENLGSLQSQSADAAQNYQNFNGAAAILDQIGTLWAPRFMAASLGGRPTERALPLDQISEPGWYGIERAGGAVARWTHKEPHVTFDWPHLEPWALDIDVGMLIGDEQLRRAEAWSGDVRLSTEAAIEEGGHGRLLISSAGTGLSASPVRMKISLPYTYRPPHEARDLGVFVRRIVLKPLNPELRKRPIQANRIEIHGPVAPGPGEGWFLLKRVTSGVFWLEPYCSAEIRFSVSPAAGPELVRSIKFYMNGQPLPVHIGPGTGGRWLARIPVANDADGGRRIKADWDLVLDIPEADSEVAVGELSIFRLENLPADDARQFPFQKLPIKIDAASLSVDPAGFHPLERDGAGIPFRWTRSEAHFHFLVDRSQVARFRLQFGGMLSHIGPGGVHCFVDGQQVATEVTAGEQSFQLAGVLPTRGARGGTTVSFLFPMASPADAGAPDARLLGAAFYWFELDKAPA